MARRTASTAEEIRQTTVRMLRQEKRQKGEPKMDWETYEAIMRESLPFTVNRGYLFSLLVAKKFGGKIRVILELVE